MHGSGSRRVMMMMVGRGDGRGLVTSHSDTTLRRAGEDVEIQLSCGSSLTQFSRRQPQVTSNRPFLTTFHCLHPPPPAPPSSPASAARGAQLIESAVITSQWAFQ